MKGSFMKKVIYTNIHIRILMALILLVFIMIFMSFSMEINAGIQKREAQQHVQGSPVNLNERSGFKE